MAFGQPQVDYVIKSWHVNPNAPTGQPIVQIHGRAPGVMSFLLSLIGIEPTVSLILTHTSVEFSQGSLFGRRNRTIPLHQVASTHYGYAKPLQYLIIGIALLPVGIGLLFLLMYFFKKSLFIGVSDTGSGGDSIKFRRAMIENQEINEQAAEYIGTLIRHYALAAR